MLHTSRILILDGQTTGLSPQRSELIEVGWSFSLDDRDIKTRLVRPATTEKVPYKVWQMTGLSPEELEREGADAASVWSEILSESSDIDAAIIHYASFELPFLKKLQNESPLPWPVICTFKLGKRLMPDLPAFTLRAMSGHFGLNLPEAHRARDHVAATQLIWRKLLEKLQAESDVQSFADLQTWIKEPREKASRKTSRRYLVQRDVRLEIPESPGVYEMLSANGSILYVGKATSLRSRVNSYFRQRRSKRSQLGELVSQVADIRVTAVETPLESALLENDRIKDIDPPYNRSLRGRKRPLLFVSTDLTRYSHHADAEFPFGPFGSLHVFDSLRRVRLLHLNQLGDREALQLGYPPEDIKAAYRDLLSKMKIDPERDLSTLELWRLGKKTLPDAEEGNEAQASVRRKLKRVARSLHQTRWLRQLLDSVISWQIGDRWRYLVIENGEVTQRGFSEGPVRKDSRARSTRRDKQNRFDQKTYDRMNILIAGVNSFVSKQIPFGVSFSKHRLYCKLGLLDEEG